MAFRTGAIYLDSDVMEFYDSAATNILSTESYATLSNDRVAEYTKLPTSAGQGAFYMGGREGGYKVNSADRYSYMTDTSLRTYHENPSAPRGSMEQYHGMLEGRTLAIGDGIVAAKRSKSTQSTSMPSGVTQGIDIFNYDGIFQRTIDVVNTPFVRKYRLPSGTYTNIDFGTSISIGEGRILVTDPYDAPDYGDNTTRNAMGSAYLFDLDGNHIRRPNYSDGAFLNSSFAYEQEYENEAYQHTDYNYRYDNPYGSEYTGATAQCTGFGMCSAIGEGRIVITAPMDVKDGLARDTLDGRGAFHIYDTNMRHIRTVINPEFNSGRVTSSNHSTTNQMEGFGRSIAIGDGRIVVGAPNWYDNSVHVGHGKGKIFVFDLDGNLLWSRPNPNTTWSTRHKDCYGNTVAIGSGRIAVGNYMYRNSGVTPSTTNSTKRHTGYFEVLDLDGNQIFSDDGDYDIVGHELYTTGEYLGFSVAITDNVVIVGSKYNDTGAYQTGSIRLYTIDGYNFQTIKSDTDFAYYGECVAGADGVIAVAEPGASYNSNNQVGLIRLYDTPRHKTQLWTGYSEEYGKPSLPTGSSYTLTANAQEIVVSDYIGSGGTLTIDSDVYVWSDDINVPAITVDIDSAAILNKGYIIGRGGDGGYRADNAEDGGDAIKILGNTGTIIFNQNDAFIAGGGGGGAGAPDNPNDQGHGGGGAGGGHGGGQLTDLEGGAGGAPGENGANGGDGGNFGPSVGIAYGGSAGGGGGGATTSAGGGGGGGGRKFFAGFSFGGAGGNGTYGDGGDGGDNGDAGDDAGPGTGGGGGGGGWGAAGGDAGTHTGGAGGAAVVGTYAQINEGTIYGSPGTTTSITRSYTVTANTQELLASDVIDRFGTITINSGVYVWSDDTSKAGLTIDVPNVTVINNGYIIGRGGDGGGNDGGPALEVTSANAIITNNSYIAGGGGGGAGRGGGGAGGGDGASGFRSSVGTLAGGTGGAPGQSGTNAATAYSGGNGGGGRGGGAGGGGGGGTTWYDPSYGGGGGGGRILPGTGGAGGTGDPSGPVYGGDGGGAGSAGSAGTSGGGSGGGGWGAAGGGSSGGAGGAAITTSGQSATFTLTNNGTVYGSTS